MNSGVTRSHLDASQYLELQRRVIEIFPFISCRIENFQTFSATLASILLDAGSLFDSFSQNLIRCYAEAQMRFSNEDQVSDYIKKVKGEMNFNMRDYQVLLNLKFKLSKREVNLNTYDDDFCSSPTACYTSFLHKHKMAPFSDWKERGKSLVWWKAFTAVKHDRSMNLKMATLTNVLLATASVFVVLTIFHEDYLLKSPKLLEILALFSPMYWEMQSNRTLMTPGFISKDI